MAESCGTLPGQDRKTIQRSLYLLTGKLKRICSERGLRCEIARQPHPFYVPRQLVMTMLVFRRNQGYVSNTHGHDGCRKVILPFNRAPSSICSIKAVR